MLKGYVTEAEVATVLGYSLDDDVQLAEVRLAIEYVEWCVEDYCQTRFEWEADTSKYFDGTGHGMLVLGFYLRNLKGVWIIDSDTNERLSEVSLVFPQPTASRHGNVYRWLEIRSNTDANGNIIDVKRVFPHGMRNVEVFGDWGFKAEDMPAPIRQAIAYAVKHFFDLRVYNDLVNTETGVNRSMQFNRMAQIHPLPTHSKRLLDYWVNSTKLTG